MDKNMELLLNKLDEKFKNQTELITYSVTKSVKEALDEKMKTITEENTKLKNKISELEFKIQRAEIEKRKNNLVFFGINENIKLETEPDTATYIQKLEREREAREKGDVKDNKSFLAKYWMYIVPIAIFVMISGASNPEPAAQGGR